MKGLRAMLLRLFDRRKRSEPVSVDRRQQKRSLKDADKRLDCAIAEFDSAVKKHTDIKRREVANDIQQTVKFKTFRDICKYAVPSGQFNICRHPKHEAANTSCAGCSEEQCPVMRGVA